MIKRFSLMVPVAAALLSIAGAANAEIIPGVYNTGLGVNGAALGAGDGQVDANYKITSTNEAGVVVGGSALTYYNPAYLKDGPLSRIVNATGNGNGTGGTTTTFSTIFSLAGFDALNATLSGQVLFDDTGEIYLNNNLLGSYAGFNSLAPFGTNQNFFNAGANTLSFVLHNGGGPEAFQVAGLTVTAERTAVAAVPETATWAMMLAGFGMIGFAARRRQSAKTTVRFA